jgi:hypothetical protein
MRWLALALFASTALGCHSPGPYGYSKVYSPLDEEDTAAAEAKEYDPVMAERFADEWRASSVSLFGVVQNRTQGPGGKTDLTLSMRSLSPRNLCDEGGEETCRVTVSEREHAIVHALVSLRKGDDVGKHSVGPGSLVRIVGRIADDVGESDGTPVFQVTYYRHWPQHFYVTTAAASYMKR